MLRQPCFFSFLREKATEGALIAQRIFFVQVRFLFLLVVSKLLAAVRSD
jgi:hypothetical protein